MFNPLVYLRERKRKLEQEEIERAKQFYLGLLKQNREKIEETAMGLVEKAFNKLPNIKEERNNWSKEYKILFGKLKREVKEVYNKLKDIGEYEGREFPVRKLQEILTRTHRRFYIQPSRFISKIEFPMIDSIHSLEDNTKYELIKPFLKVEAYFSMDDPFKDEICTCVGFQSTFLSESKIIPFDYKHLEPENNKLDGLMTKGNPKIDYDLSCHCLLVKLRYKFPINEKPYHPLHKGIEDILNRTENILSEG